MSGSFCIEGLIKYFDMIFYFLPQVNVEMLKFIEPDPYALKKSLCIL